VRIIPGDPGQEFVLEFSSESEYEHFFEVADRQGFFTICADAISIPCDALFRARAYGSTRSRRIRPLKILQQGNEFLITIHSGEPLAPVAAESAEANYSQEIEEEPENKTPEFLKSLRDTIRGMPITEKLLLAVKADFLERRVLMQENNPKVHEFLLRNVRITEREIAWMARNPSSPMQTILTIANHREWMSSDAIRAAILTNPKTPAVFVIERIPHLSEADLVKLYHSRFLREDVLKRIKSEIGKRHIRIKKIQ